LSLIGLALLESLMVMKKVTPLPEVRLWRVFLMGVDTGRELLWAPFAFQAMVAIALVFATPRSWRRWASLGLAAAASSALALHLYQILTSYPPFRGRFYFMAAYAALALFLVWWAFTLLPTGAEAPSSRWRRLLEKATPILALAGFAAAYFPNSALHPDDYLELHFSALQVCYVLVHAGLTGLLLRSRHLAAAPRPAQLGLVLGLGMVLAAGPLLGRGESHTVSQSAFRRFTTLGKSLAFERPRGMGSAPGARRVPDDPKGEARFARHSGLPALPASFSLEAHNILLVSIETLRYRDTSLADPKLGTSPNLLRFAEAGRHSFTSAHTPAPYTLQTFASMFGMTYPSLTRLVLGYNSWDGTIPPECHLVPEILKESGYSNFWIGHNHGDLFGRLVRGLGQGFDEVWHGEKSDPKADVQIVSNAIRAIERRRSNRQRFFGWVFLESPHHDYVAHYDDLPKATKLDRYRQEIRFADEQLGKLFAYLEETGLLNKTIVIVHGDHGEEFGEHGGWHHSGIYSEVTHVPLVIHVPGFPNIPGRAHAAPTSLAYVFPWLLQRGAPAARDAALKGMRHAFGPMLRETGNAVVIERLHRHHPRMSLVYPRERLVYDLASRHFELYDLESDPNERKNVFVRGTARARRLMTHVNGYLGVVGSRRLFRFEVFED
jgi:arylsulfatase A-like enzyme